MIPLDHDNRLQKNTIFSISSISSATVNNTIFLYGGELGKEIYNENIWTISPKDILTNSPPTLLMTRQNEILYPNLNLSPGGVIINNSIITPCSNMTSSASVNVNNNTATVPNHISICSIDLSNRSKNNTWSIIPPSSSSPTTRKGYSVTATRDTLQLYLFGGEQTTANTSLQQLNNNNDFWLYSIESQLWSRLVSPFNNNLSRCGHTASMLSDGRIVIIGGYTCFSEPSIQREKATSLDLIEMNQLLVFDTRSSAWSNVSQVQGLIPLPRTYHSAIVMNANNDIFICGGQNEVKSPFQVYLGSQIDQLKDMVAILDTNSWTWKTPIQSHLNQPYPQSFATLSMVNETKLVFGYGVNYHTVYDEFRVFDTLTETWQQTATPKQISNRESITSSFNTTILWIIMGCIGIAIAFSYGVAIWKVGFKRFHTKVRNGLVAIKKETWKPRVGEPGWAETLRLVLKLLFLFFFVYLISTLTNQVINSPIIDQLSFESNPEMNVDVPEIKFCFEKNDNDDIDSIPFIQCATDFGAQCSQFITTLQGPKKTENEKHCLLFNAPLSFKLGQTSERLFNNGSFLKFEYYYKKNGSIPIVNDINTGSSQLQVQVYNKLHVQTVGDSFHSGYDADENDGSSYGLVEEGYYKFATSKGRMIKNSYQLKFGFTSTINFELIKRVTLNSGVWNYAGIASSVSTKYEIDTAETPEYFSTVYDPSSGAPQPLGSLRVVPLTCQTKVLREQKAFAFINAMGIFGGLFGLLFSLQSCLFGYRPRSPWGYMHRWSFGQLRSSLMRGLQVNFFQNNVAFANIQRTPSSSIHQQNQFNKFIIPNAIDHQKESTNINIDQIMSKSTVHPLTIQTKNLHNNTSYLLPTSPTLSIPLANGDDKELRMTLIEDRIHMLERLFQAYYIDDEIFRSLDYAIQSDSSSSSSASPSLAGGHKHK